MTETPSRLRRHKVIRIAIGVSIAVHLVAGVILYRHYRPDRQTQQSASTGDSESRPEAREETAEPAKLDSPEDVDSKVFKNQLAKAAAETAAIGEEQNLERLEGQLQRLDQITTEENIIQISDRIKNWMNVPERATEPDPNPPEGDFDHSTAQIFKMSRRRSDSGEWIYDTQLLDANGRVMDVELTQEEGGSAYQTFRLLGGSKIGRSLYQNIVLPLLDQSASDETVE